MSFVTSKQLLLDACRGGYALGAFNFENMEMAMAIIRAAEQLRAPVILQTTPSTVKYASTAVFANLVRALAEQASVPVALHLDHGSSVALAKEAIGSGYTSVMIDGSRLSLEDNIAVTRETVLFASERGIPVEAELGTVGGKEDGITASGTAYTDPTDAVRFVKESGCDFLAVGIGTAHGIYVGTPVLDVERLSRIRSALEQAGLALPLVLHGASGLSDTDVKETVSRGIAKVNFATELRQAYTKATRTFLSENGTAFDPKKYGTAAMAAVEEAVKYRIRICGADGRV